MSVRARSDNSEDDPSLTGGELTFGACYSFDAALLAMFNVPGFGASTACTGGGSCGSMILTGKCPDMRPARVKPRQTRTFFSSPSKY